MKKTIISIAVLVVLFILFFVSTSYMNSINEKFFNYVSKNTLYYQVEDVNYTKSLLNSQGNFIIKLNDLPYEFKVNANFSNVFFASNNVKISITNQNDDFKDIFPNEEIGNINAKFNPFNINSNINLKLKINNVNYNNEQTGSIKWNDIYIALNTKEGLVKDIIYNIGDFSVDDKINIKNAHVVEIPITALKFEDIFNPTRNSEQNISIEYANFTDEAVFDNLHIYAKTIPNTQNDYNNDLKLTLNKLHLIQEDLLLNNINLDANFNNISKKAYEQLMFSPNIDIFFMMAIANEFLKANPEIILNNLSFEKEEKKFNANAQAIFTQNNIKSQLHINTQILPSQFWPTFEYFDSYFVDENGTYVLDFIYDDSDKNDIKTIINGEGITLNPQ